jgi:ABC-2 type transport system ATP-binding protein
MGASQFVGRVGGLAVALGVGAAIFSTAGVAFADRGAAPDTRSSAGSSDSSSSGSQSSAPERGRNSGSRGAAAASTVVAQQTRNSHSVAPGSAPEPVSAPAAVAAAEPASEAVAAAPAAAAAVAAPAPAAVKAAEAVAPEAAVEDVVAPVESVVAAEPAPEAAPADEVVAYSAAGSGSETGGAGSDPSAPVGHPLVDLVLASFIRRESAAASATGSPAANASTGLTVDPKTTYYDGVLQGNLNVVSASGCGNVGSDCKLTYSFLGSSDGGKLDLNDVPVALDPALPDGAKGGAGSYTFLPYATWIDPANPTKNPIAAGSQTFTVRVSENTAFDQFLSGIPLIGGLNQKVIDLLQQTPFIGNLLAPLIGSTVKSTVNVQVGALVTLAKPVAYTIMVTSFDGTQISTNFFPASENSLIFPGNEQATIFNGPGLGSPGVTKPYDLFQAAGSAPGLALLRGQSLPDPYGSLPLGFNVITWDPRGEFASGGVLQLDNPMYEGRDVTALIDWANANTGLLNEDGTPSIGMVGGSYGGGIQMTTVDPRIKAVIPAIAWNTLNQSIYPDQIFKTGWANALALALLSTGARVNNQINMGILTGNLFGFISDSAQAVLGSSGPASLLTKLDAATMYVQGTVDGLFPLMQAIINAQTQLEQNPYFSGENADLVKMIWFCGGHGICLDEGVDQTKQATSIFLQDMVWLNKYAKDYLQPYWDLFPAIPTFQWWDQAGTHYASTQMPFADGFVDGDVVASGAGGSLGFFQFRNGGSGPFTDCSKNSTACEWPLNQTFATDAKNAINVSINVPNKDTKIVGAPTVTFTYRGSGNAQAVYGQIVDEATGRVLGNINTPILVTLDGKTHTVTANLNDIAYTAPADNSTLTLQIVGNASAYKNSKWGSVSFSDVSVTLPTTTNAVPVPA